MSNPRKRYQKKKAPQVISDPQMQKLYEAIKIMAQNLSGSRLTVKIQADAYNLLNLAFRAGWQNGFKIGQNSIPPEQIEKIKAEARKEWEAIKQNENERVPE